MEEIDNKKAHEIRNDFPIFDEEENSKLIYLDNSSTTQKPVCVISAIMNFYETENANIQRGLYKLGQNITHLYDEAHSVVAKFIGAEDKEIIFTRNTTESINLLSYSLPSILPKEKDEIVLTEEEHHANLIPWQQLAKKGYKLKFIKLKGFELDYEDAKKKINEKTAIVSVSYMSNVLGIKNNVNAICEMAKKVGAISVVDAAQAMLHNSINVKEIGCDFLAFSGHKMFAPTGIGVLYGRRELLNAMEPFQTGGGMINSVSFEKSTWADLPMKFEAGTPNIEGAIGLMQAIVYINKIGVKNIGAWTDHLKDMADKGLRKLGAEIYGGGGGIISFNIPGIHPHDISSLLDDYNICIKGGYHCAMPLMKVLGVSGTCRISFSVYNSEEEVEEFLIAMKEIIKDFK